MNKKRKNERERKSDKEVHSKSQKKHKLSSKDMHTKIHAQTKT